MAGRVEYLIGHCGLLVESIGARTRVQIIALDDGQRGAEMETQSHCSPGPV